MMDLQGQESWFNCNRYYFHIYIRQKCYRNFCYLVNNFKVFKIHFWFRLLFIGGSLESPKWLICCCWPKILGWWWGHMKVFCRSVNVHGVVVLFAGSGYT